MKNKYGDIFFLLLIMEIFTITTLLLVKGTEISFADYVLYMLNFLVIVISFYFNLITGLLTSALLVFGYGSYMLYGSLFDGKMNVENSYFWMILFPVSAFISGNLSITINEILDKYMKLEKQINNLVTVDETTGFHNSKEFYKDLNEEMSRSRRHNFSLVVMLIEIQYLEEIISIYGIDSINKIFKAMAGLIENVTRTEDKKYKIDEGLFAIIMPNTDILGAQTVKERLKKQVENLVINEDNKVKSYKLEVKAAAVQYDEKIENAFEFKEYVQKELEYDI